MVETILKIQILGSQLGYPLGEDVSFQKDEILIYFKSAKSPEEEHEQIESFIYIKDKFNSRSFLVMGKIL